ncbi:5'-3' exonuclease [Williamsoniiplasma lucivorax]|uniref:5'-3' exonuclease n=1 Tax=Williamsoniiplasma lucivorax TaxID=209274 RepID=A0A2S5REU2_9MOLU|nr:5'-3' exonuclease [Williamsoniiplasma lucivorax]PPE05831.1 DNA polymerase I [Williamsoniiplasma lucivorax]
MIIDNEQRTILLIDGYHLLHKGFYGSLKRKTLAVNRDGVPINAIYTFVAKINSLIEMGIYHTIIVTFDVGNGCWRRDLYPEYKAKRKDTPEELIPQMQIIREFLTAARIPWYEKEEYEGDDVMGTIVNIACKLGYNVHILSNDKDTFQLVSDNTKIITRTSKKEKPEFIETRDVIEKIGCEPAQVPDLKSLMGDSSDNIKGIKCLHYNTATSILKKYGTIENVYKHIDELPANVAQKFVENKEQILLNKRIATIQRNLNLGRIDLRPLKVNWYGYLTFLKKHKMWAFTGSALKKIEEIKKKEFKPQVKKGNADAIWVKKCQNKNAE